MLDVACSDTKPTSNHIALKLLFRFSWTKWTGDYLRCVNNNCMLSLYLVQDFDLGCVLNLLATHKQVYQYLFIASCKMCIENSIAINIRHQENQNLYQGFVPSLPVLCRKQNLQSLQVMMKHTFANVHRVTTFSTK